MKAILLSIKPEWLVKILNGEKTIEVRKNKALANAIRELIKQYGKALICVYCSKSKPYKALKILKNKQVNMRIFVVSALLNEHKTPDAYNFTVSADKNTALTQEEWDLLKEVFKL